MLVVSSSAIVLLAALKCEILDMSPNDMLFQNCWNKCLDILHYYEGRVHSAPYAIRSLTAVRSQIVQQKSGKSLIMRPDLIFVFIAD